MHTPLFRTRRHLLPTQISLFLVAASAMTITGCQSALGPTSHAHDSDPYYQSLVVHEMLKGAYSSQNFVAGTINGGVREYARVDEAGFTPMPATGPASGPATGPTSRPSIANASLIGLPYAALNQAEPIFNLSLQEAIARTVKHSLAIKVEAYNPAIKESLVISAEAAFDPIFFGQTQYALADDPQTTANSLANGTSLQNQYGVRRLLPTGGTVQASVGSNYRDITVPTGSFPPAFKSFYTSNLALQITQPLLRGFGSDVSQANIYLAQKDLRISLSEFKLNVIKSVADVENAYMALVQLRTNVEVLERLVVSSEQTYNDIIARSDIDATVASINQARSALESRRADLFIAQKSLRSQSDALKTLINDPQLDINSNILINPTDRPLVQPVTYNAVDCIEIALRQRPEMQQARLQVERADIFVTVSRNDLLPKVDVTASVQANGLDHGFDQSITRTIDPMNSIDATFGFKIEVPLGNRDAEARAQQRKLERNQAITNLVEIAQKVIQDVKLQVREVQSSYAEIEIRDRVREAAALEFQGIIDIEDIRARSPEFLQLKLDSQARLAQAEQQLTQTIINYNVAIMRLEQSKGTLLEFDRISLDHPPTPENDALNTLRVSGNNYIPK